ncbi:MAG: TolC family protein [Prevotellaceae bacterium]|nr:TolC family protein [Prevotellaceae bacterium]MDY3364908.1 TolC family protein [Prevotella sp.]
MKRTLYIIAFVVSAVQMGHAQLTLEKCQEMAQQNYPLIKQYDLIGETTRYTVDNIRKEWLPQASATAQTTWQNAVSALPDALTGMMATTGNKPEGMNKLQYRAGVDVNQLVWDGGRLHRQGEMARLQGKVESAQAAVSMYEIKQRVNELFFGILLVDEQLIINTDLQALLQSNENKFSAMLKNGVVLASDVDKIKAERLHAVQQHTDLQAMKRSLQRMLALFCGTPVIDELVRPPLITAVEASPNNRPEIRLIESQLLMTDIQEQMLKTQLMPRLNAFAQGFYGYPGFNMFEDMMRRNLSFNALVGLRLSWNIGSLYTYKNNRKKLDLQRQQAENNREIFIFNNRLEQTLKSEQINRLAQLRKSDDEIVTLRTAVRKAAEAKLEHGIIDTNNLLEEITRENNAKTNRSIHEIEQLKAIYELKNVTN